MKTAIGHLRANVIAYLALFVALGGTSYAAISIPAGSVTNRDIANRTITPGKLNFTAAHSFGGYVRDWASVNADGTIAASNRTAGNSAGGGPQSPFYAIRWTARGHAFDPIGLCVSEVTVQGSTALSAPGAFATAITGQGGFVTVHTYSASGVPTPEAFYVVVIC